MRISCLSYIAVVIFLGSMALPASGSTTICLSEFGDATGVLKVQIDLIASEARASVNPSSAMAEALKLAQKQVLASLNDTYSVYEANVGVGKYSKGSFGDYSVELHLTSQNKISKVCRVDIRIEKAPVGEQKDGFFTLETVASQYQIMAKTYPFSCDNEVEM